MRLSLFPFFKDTLENRGKSKRRTKIWKKEKRLGFRMDGRVSLSSFAVAVDVSAGPAD